MNEVIVEYFLKLVILKIETLFGPIKPTSLNGLKGHSSFGITALLYTYQACKTLFRPIKPTKPSV